MYAGLSAAAGAYTAILDADMQDPPSLLPEMFSWIKQGYDSVATRRVTRKGEPPIRSFFARMFYRLMNKISKTEIVDGARDFQMMNRTVVDAILSMGEYNRFSKGIFSWVGFKTKWVPFVNVERVAGETKWSFTKLVRYSIDGMMAFSTKPLALSSILGVISCAIAIITLLVTVVKTLIFGNPVAGYPTIVSLILLVGGLLMFFIGMLGQYLAKTYMEAKHRPIYIVRETEEGLK